MESRSPDSLHLPQPSDVWGEAHDRLLATANYEEYDSLLILSLEGTADEIAMYRDAHASSLTPEGVFFLTISEAAKRSRAQ